MAYSVTVTKHNVAFPSKIRSGGDGHTLNMFVAADTDNGVVGSVGAWKDFDRYTFTAGNTSFQGKLHAAANDTVKGYVLELFDVFEESEAIFVYNTSKATDLVENATVEVAANNKLKVTKP